MKCDWTREQRAAAADLVRRRAEDINFDFATAFAGVARELGIPESNLRAWAKENPDERITHRPDFASDTVGEEEEVDEEPALEECVAALVRRDPEVENILKSTPAPILLARLRGVESTEMMRRVVEIVTQCDVRWSGRRRTKKRIPDGCHDEQIPAGAEFVDDTGRTVAKHLGSVVIRDASGKVVWCCVNARRRGWYLVRGRRYVRYDVLAADMKSGDPETIQKRLLAFIRVSAPELLANATQTTVGRSLGTTKQAVSVREIKVAGALRRKSA